MALIQSIILVQQEHQSIVFELGVPILGICYGMQIMAVQLGGDANSAEKAEFGFAQVRARNHSELLRDISDEINADWSWLVRCMDESRY